MNDEDREGEGQVEGNRLAIMAPGRAGRPASSMPFQCSVLRTWTRTFALSRWPSEHTTIQFRKYTIQLHTPQGLLRDTITTADDGGFSGHPSSKYYYDSEAWETVGSQSIEVANASDDFGGADLRGSLPLWKASFSFPIELGVSVPREVDAKESVGSSNSVYVVPSDLLSAQTRMMSAGYIPFQ